jgi:tetratricopeptide (TPR) repeat protein
VKRLATSGFALLFALGAARAAQPPVLKDLDSRAAPIDRAAPATAGADQAVRGYEAFLKMEGTDPALRAQALRRVGDLRLASAEALRGQDAAPSGLAASEGRAAIAAYEQLLREYPDYPSTDAVLYQLARAYDAAEQPDRAQAVLDRLVAAYPAAVRYDEAQFRRGETLFAQRRYADAERAYAAVLGKGAGSEFYIQALYKRAWSQFKQSMDAESSASFLALLDRLLVAADGRLRPAGDLSRPEREMADDALRALSLTFAGTDGTASLQAALARHGAVPYESQLYRALGELYVEKERYQDGAQAYREFAAHEPRHPDSPAFIGFASDAYAKGGFPSLVLEAKQELVERYGPRSAYWQSQSGRLSPPLSDAVQADLLDLGRYHHARAQKDGSAADRDLAVRWYREYLEGFDSSPQAAATRLALADALYEGSNFDAAATEYERAAYGYPVAPDAARAGYAALVCYDKAEARLPAAERPAVRGKAVESALRFAAAFPGHPETPAVLSRTTQTLFDAGDRERAAAVAQQVLALGSRADAGQQRVAWAVLANVWFDAGQFAQAEQGFSELLARMPAGDPQRAEVTERLAASVYRQAEAKQAAGDWDGASREYLRVSRVAPTSAAGPKGEFDAATLLVNQQQWARAATVLEDFRRDHPQHELQPEATRKLAVAYLEGGRKHDAAVEFERIANRDLEDPDVRRAAAWQAAELYGGSGDAASAARAYEAYVSRYPSPAGPAIEARQELAELAGRAGDTAGRQRWLKEVVAADASAGNERSERTRYLAASAALELARPLDAQARAVRLAMPLEKSLRAKRKAMEAALAAYAKVEDYGVAPVTTAATFARADLYRHLGRSLLESDRPRDLSAEEREQYDLLLEEQAFPFEEKAIAIHEENARRAAQGIYDEWVRRSFDELAAMNPARYARKELAAPAVAAPVASDGAASASELNRLGVAAREAGRFGDARTAYEGAIAADPAYADAERNLGILLDLYLGESAAALPHYERCLALQGGADKELKAWIVELQSRLQKAASPPEARS